MVVEEKPLVLQTVPVSVNVPSSGLYICYHQVPQDEEPRLAVAKVVPVCGLLLMTSWESQWQQVPIVEGYRPR